MSDMMINFSNKKERLIDDIESCVSITLSKHSRMKNKRKRTNSVINNRQVKFPSPLNKKSKVFTL